MTVRRRSFMQDGIGASLWYEDDTHKGHVEVVYGQAACQFLSTLTQQQIVAVVEQTSQYGKHCISVYYRKED